VKVYGLRIGSVGVEFSDQQSREKAMLLFTKGSCVIVSSCEGARYSDSDGAFSTYERETNEQTTNCSRCKGSFSSEVCTQRSVPYMNYSGHFVKESTERDFETKYLCDGCFAKINADFEVFKAKQVVASAES